eukprot:7961813-Alexandrium_andersonii.AAC.1
MSTSPRSARAGRGRSASSATWPSPSTSPLGLGSARNFRVRPMSRPGSSAGTCPRRPCSSSGKRSPSP